MNAQPGLPHGFGNRGVPDIASINQLGSILRPSSGGMALSGNSLGSVQQQKSRLSLWLNQSNPHVNSSGEILPSSNLFGSSSSSGLPEMLQMGSANSLFGSSPMPYNFGGCDQFPSASGGLSANLSLSPLKEEVGNKVNIVETPAVTYDCPGMQLKPDMSATALLQKAAQLGSTRSNPSAIFGNAFGVMMSSPSNPSTTGFDTLIHQNRMSDYDQQIPHLIPNMKAVTENFGGHSSLSSTGMVSSSLDRAQLSLHQGVSNSTDHNSLTRDFLGVSGETGPPFSPQDLAKLASMNSAMGLSGQYNGNN